MNVVKNSGQLTLPRNVVDVCKVDNSAALLLATILTPIQISKAHVFVVPLDNACASASPLMPVDSPACPLPEFHDTTTGGCCKTQHARDGDKVGDLIPCA
jgi:hypothetical protein